MEATTPDLSFRMIPKDILTQVFSYLSIAPDRWNCLFVSFNRAVQLLTLPKIKLEN